MVLRGVEPAGQRGAASADRREAGCRQRPQGCRRGQHLTVVDALKNRICFFAFLALTLYRRTLYENASDSPICEGVASFVHTCDLHSPLRCRRLRTTPVNPVLLGKVG